MLLYANIPAPKSALRGVERIFGTARQTISRWLREAVARLPASLATLLPAQPDDILELDELWSLVYKKDQKRWIWLTLCRRTWQIVAYFIGDRSDQPPTYQQCSSYSDF